MTIRTPCLRTLAVPAASSAAPQATALPHCAITLPQRPKGDNQMRAIGRIGTWRLFVAGAAMLAALGPGAARAQAMSNPMQGHWSVVEISTERDGVKTHTMGPNPLGVFIFDAGGRYSVSVFRPDLPKFASNNRMTGTADENKAVVQGSIAHFGTYKFNAADGTFTVTPTASTFPNWTGVEQPSRKLTFSGDTMTITNPAGSAGGVARIVLKRLQ